MSLIARSRRPAALSPCSYAYSTAASRCWTRVRCSLRIPASRKDSTQRLFIFASLQHSGTNLMRSGRFQTGYITTGRPASISSSAITVISLRGLPKAAHSRPSKPGRSASRGWLEGRVYGKGLIGFRFKWWGTTRLGWGGRLKSLSSHRTLALRSVLACTYNQLLE